MKIKHSQGLWTTGLSASVGASLLCFSSSAANAEPTRNQHHVNNWQTMHQAQGSRVERESRRNQSRGERWHDVLSANLANQRNATAAIFPGQVSVFHTSRPHHLAHTVGLAQTTYINDRGVEKDLSRGVSLDLSSRAANIKVGAGLLTGNVTLSEGGSTRVISAGSSVTAAEYAALNEKLATGNQGLSLTKNGVADGGSLNLNNVSDDGSTIRASQLVVPANVAVTGDFARSADGVRVTNDVINYGSIYAVSSDASKQSAVIAARDIQNNSSGLISSETSSSRLDLSLRASRDLSNDGSIKSSGDLELSAGRSLRNNSVLQATGSIVLNSSDIVNRGSIVSTENNVTVTSAADANLMFDNSYGTVGAASGAINIREAGYAGTGNSTVYGGDLLSHDVNVNAGEAIANLTVNELTGTVNTTGLGAHVSANTRDLLLGNQCLTGDPTYYNTGNVVLGGDITVQENLAIIAGGNITTNQTSLSITARSSGTGQGFNIVMVAGANVTAGSGETPATLPSQPPISGNATGSVSFSTNSASGGNIDLTGATGSLTMDADSNNGNLNGGNVTLAAFASGANNGRILLNTNSNIFASGNGTGNNGNVRVIAGAANGTAIKLGQIDNNDGTGLTAGTGDVFISNSQPKSSNANPITFGTNGSITSGNSIVSSATFGGGDVSVGNLQSQQNITIESGGKTSMGALNNRYNLVKITSVGDLTMNTIGNGNNNIGKVQLTSQGNITFNDSIRADNGILVVAGGDLITGGGSGAPALFCDKNGDAGNLSVIAGAAFTVNANDVTVTGASGTGGSILFTSGQQIQQLAASSNNNGSGGIVNLVAFNGVIHIPIITDVRAVSNNNDNSNSHANGTINIVAGLNSSDAIQMSGAVADGSSNSTGDVNIFAATPNATGGNPVILSSGASFAGITSGTFLGGAVTANSGVTIGRGVVSVGGDIAFGGGSAGISFGRIASFGTFDVNSLGDITNHATLDASINGAGDRSNTMLWTALGNISFSGDMKLHATGSGITSTTGGGGFTLVAGGTVQTIVNDLGGFSEGALEANSGLNGGNITVVSGANYTRNANTVTINGPSGTGGSIRFDGSAVGFTGRAIDAIDSHSQGANFNGGDINLISYGSIGAVAGNNIFTASGFGTGQNGVVTFVAPGSIVFSKINLSGLGGGIVVRAGTPSAGTIDTTSLGFSFGKTTAGSFLSGALVANAQNYAAGLFSSSTLGVGINIATASNITLGNIDLRSNTTAVAGGSLFLQSGGNVTVGTVDVSNSNANGDAGVIDITSNSNTALNVGGGGANGTGALSANAGSTTGDGGTVRITNTGSGGVLITSVPSQTVVSGNGASLELDAGSGNLNLTALGASINRSGVGTNKDGGSILLSYGTLTAPAGAITLTANATGTGAGGDISVQTSSASLTIGSGNGEYIVSNSGTGGTLDFHAGGSLTLAATGSVNADNILFKTDTGSITINKAIVAQDVRLNSATTTILTAGITADPITIVSKQAVTLNNLTANGGILVVSGSDITSAGAIAIDASNNAGNGGNVVLVAGANFIDNGTTVKLVSASGGNISLATAGTTLTTASSLAGSSGGELTIMALENGAGTGKVTFNTAATVTTGGSGAGQNGNVVVLGDASSGAAITFGNVNTNGGTGITGGDITFAASTPTLVVASAIQQSDASYTGSFVGGATKNGNVTVGTTTINGGAATSITSGGSVTSAGITANGGAVSISSGATGSVTVNGVGVTSNASGTAKGGTISITSGSGGLTATGISSNGGGTGVGGSGGSITIIGNSNALLSLPSIQSNGGGTNGGGGDISVSNVGTGGVTFNNATFSLTGNGAGGHLTVDGKTGPISITGATVVSTNAGGAGFANGSIDILGSSISSTGALTLQSTTGLAGTGTLNMVTSVGDLTTGGNSLTMNAGGAVTLNIAGGDISTSAAAGAAVNITAGSISAPFETINASSTTPNNPGAPINISATGAVSLGTLLSNGVGTGAGGNITVSGSGINLVSIVAVGGASGGTLSLTSTNSDIKVSGSVTTGGAGALNVTLAGGTPGNATFGFSNVSKLTGAGGGLITFDNTGNAITIGGIGASQSMIVSTTNSGPGITTSTALNTTGTITLNTPIWNDTANITAGQFTVQNLTGSGLIIFGSGNTITGTNPAGGTPGNPSSPTALLFQTKDNATLTLNGTMNFAGGDLEIRNLFGTTVSSNGSLFASTKNIVLNTGTWSQVGTGNITASNLIVNLLAGGTIVNTTGDVNLAGNITLNGHDLAILASGNINAGAITINLSGQNAGDLTMIAGFAFSPNSGGQIATPNPVFMGSPGTGSINAPNLTINLSDTSASGGTGGDLIAFAHNGTVALGAINTSSTNGSGGTVTVAGDSGVTTGNITTTGGTFNGAVTLAVASSGFFGSPVFNNGKISGGSLSVGGLGTGDLSVSSINAGRGVVSLTTSGASSTIFVNGALTANSILIAAELGSLNLTASNTITAQRDAANNGGSIDITAATVITNPAGALILNATGTGTGIGGTLSYTNLSTTPLVVSSSNFVFNAGSTVAGGTVFVHAGGDLEIKAGAFNNGATNGNGGQISLFAGDSGTGQLILTDTSFFSQASGTGAAGNGGILDLEGVGIVFTSSSGAPLQISANGSGTGNGGQIFYEDSSTLQTFIGAPTKAPKGAANFVTLSAVSGLNGGNGGTIDFSVGGNLTANSANIVANPRDGVGNWDGAAITLDGGSKLSKGGVFVLNGDLTVDAVNNGNGGNITLSVRSTKAFVLSTTKLPKTGVFGTLSAQGNNGRVDVFNLIGGITVSQSTALNAFQVGLATSGKGAIAAGKGIAIGAGDELFLSSSTASIGKKGLLVNAPVITVGTQGSVNLTNQFSGPTVIRDINVGGSVVLVTNGPTTLNDISTANGSITVTSSVTNSGLLELNSGKNIVATNGSVTLQNLDTTNGSILIDDFSSVKTAGQGGAVSISIGAPPKSGTNTTPPSGISVTGSGGTAFFGPGGVSTTGNATVNVKNADVIFNVTGGNTIVLGNGVLIEADPPSPTGMHSSVVPSLPINTDMFKTPSTGTLPVSVELPAIGQLPDISTQFTGSLIQNSGVSDPSATTSQATLTDNNLSLLFGTISDTNYGGATERGSRQESASDLIIDASLHRNAEPHQIMNHGNVVFSPVADTTIQSAHGVVRLAAGSVTLLMQSEQGLSVYNLDDHHSNSVVIESQGRKFALSPGRHVLISKHRAEQFAEVNAIELVQYRGVSKTKLADGSKVYSSEFLIPSAYYAVRPLRSLLSSKHPGASKTAQHMLKTSAIIMTLNPDRGDFVQYFKPKSMAYANAK